MMPAAFFLALALAGQAGEAEVRTAPCALPPALTEALQSRFGSSRVLTVADLYEDERALFRAEHPGGCPGVRAGKFFGAKERPALAVIVMGGGSRKDLRLIVARPAMATWILFEVEELREGSTAVVGSERGPGAKDASADRTPSEVLTLTAYEAWKRVYRWNGRTFEPPLQKD